MTQRRHEAPEVGAMVGRMLRALVRRAAEGDTEALEQLAHLEDLAAAATTLALVRANVDAGYTFGELASVTSTSRQAVRQRVGRFARLPGPAVEFLGR